MQRVHTTRTLADAHLARSVLENDGIRAELRNDQLAGTEGGGPVSPEMWPQVWVADEDVERAAAVLSDVRGDVRGDGDTGSIDDLEASDGDDGWVQEALSDLFSAVRRLNRDPRQGHLVDEVERLRVRIAGSPVPYGIEPRAWDDLAARTSQLRDASAAGHEDLVREQAASLRTVLAPLVGAVD